MKSLGYKLNSPFADERQRGFRGLRFSAFVEDEFRASYAKSNAFRARLVMVTAAATILILIGARLTEPGFSKIMVAFELFIMLPCLAATLYTSYLPGRHRLFEFLLTSSALLLGLMITSIVTRAALLGMHYYFAACVAWLFAVWLMLGLPLRHAAFAALATSATYVWGTFYWDFTPAEAFFELAMLALVNATGIVCCYQLERASRKSFLESRVLGELADQDGLTGLNNRRSFDRQLDRLWRQSRREQTQLTLLLVDIDHFKDYNDHYGHQAGDDALKRVAEVIGLAAQRPLDIAARFGGEEFALLLYGPANEYGREIPGHIRRTVQELKIPHRQSSTHPYLTVSVGVSISVPEAERSMNGVIQLADEALYQAKEDGRNKVVVKESINATMQTGRFRVASRRAAVG